MFLEEEDARELSLNMHRGNVIEGSDKEAFCKQGGEISLETNPLDTLILDLEVTQPVVFRQGHPSRITQISSSPPYTRKSLLTYV